MDTGEQPYDDRHGPRPKSVGREVGDVDLQYEMRILAQSINHGDGSTLMREAASAVLYALRMYEDLERARDAEDVDPPGPMPGTPLDTESGLRYIAPGGKFAAYWTGEGNGPQLAQVSLLGLRILAAHLTTAIDHVTGELELRRH